MASNTKDPGIIKKFPKGRSIDPGIVKKLPKSKRSIDPGIIKQMSSRTTAKSVSGTAKRSGLAKTSKPKGPVYVFPDGSTVGVKDLGKVKPTPKPKKPSPIPTISDKEYFRRQQEYIASQKKKAKKK